MNGSCPKIVLTGGPGGGKTTAADLFRRELGEKVVIVPEAATMMFSGGFPRSFSDDIVRSTQRAIYSVQKNLEDIHHKMYKDRILLCDRGTLDGFAYWPKSDKDFFEELNTNIEQELNRYDAVVFFESAAVGNLMIEGGNPARVEDLEQARKLDQTLRDIWSKHKNFIWVPHQQSFFKKMSFGLSSIEGVVKSLVK